MIRPGSVASSAASCWSSLSPHGSMSTTGPRFEARIASTASITGSGFMTIPGPPPNGMSSTCRWRSCVKSRRSCAEKPITPRSMARPITPCLKTGPNIAGKIVTMSNLIVSARVLEPEHPVGHDDAPALEVDGDDGVPGRGDQPLDRPLPAHPHVIGGPLQDLVDDAGPGARGGEDLEADHLPVIEVALLQRPLLLVGDFQVATAEELGQRPVVDAAELEHNAGVAVAAPLDLVRAPVEDEL